MKPKVSIIIPIHNQYNYLKDCVTSIKEKTKGIPYELVLVDDASAEREVIDFLKFHPLETVRLDPNHGFIRACNAGAKRAVGEYLLFLNTDTLIFDPLWLKKMVSCFQKDPKIGIVGAKLLLANDTIQHAGMEYVREQMNFMHTNYGKDRNDPSVCESRETGMVTGACLMIPKKVWEELGGFDERLVGGTFEDTFLALKAKEKGYKVWYCAEAELYHFQSQSMGSGGGVKAEWFIPNWELFKQEYIRTGKLGHYPRIAACMIAFNEDDYIEASLKSLYGFVQKIVVIEGSTEHTREFADSRGYSSDRTNQILESFPDPERKIEIVHGAWKDKKQMRNEYCKHLEGMDYAFIVDADEVWPIENLLKIEQILFARPEIRAISFNMHEFWHDLAHKCRGIWENFLGRKTIIKLDKGLRYEDHLIPVDNEGQMIEGITALDIHFFHYNYAKSDEKIKNKIQYYLNRGTPGFKLEKDWFEKVWMGWKIDPAYVEKEFGTHPFGGGWTQPWYGRHPEAMEGHPKFEEYLSLTNKRAYLTTRKKDVPGYVNFNMEEHDLRAIPAFGFYDIVADDCLEHFSYRETAEILLSWHERLAPGGRLTVITPDLRQVAGNYLNGKWNYMMAIQFLFALQTYKENFHHVLFDEPAIRELMGKIGFKNVRVESYEPAFLRATGWK